MGRLESARAKLERAIEHAHALDLTCQAFLKTNPYTTIGKFDPDSRKYGVHLNVRTEPSPQLSTVLGDLLFNLRSALDNAVFELAVLHSKQDPPPDEGGIEFPIFIDRPPFEARKNRCIGALNADAQTFIKGLQPFHDAKTATANTLWVLHELNRRDKHRRLHAVTCRIGDKVIFRDTAPPGLDITVHAMTPPIALEDDTELLTLSIGGTEPEVEVNVDMAFDFDDSRGKRDQPRVGVHAASKPCFDPLQPSRRRGRRTRTVRLNGS